MARGGGAAGFPGTAGAADDLAYIAQLDAMRFRGYRHLVLPEGSRRWFRSRNAFRDHVTRAYRTVVDEPGAGAVFDLAGSADTQTRSVRAEITRLAVGRDEPLSVLDWTAAGVPGDLPGAATFRPPAGDRLPYLDATIDVVVVDDASVLDEASRVASLATVQVAPGALGAEIVDVRYLGAVPEMTSPRVVVWSDDHDDEWRAFLAERVAAAGAELRFDTIDDRAVAVGDLDVAVFVEPYVLPLPGAIEEAARLAVAHPMHAVAGKVIRSDGTLDSAGGSVFADRSVALVAEGLRELSAPWHDYVRPVCWAPGILAASAECLGRVRVPVGVAGRAFMRESCAAVWAAGGSVTYHPTVAAVRVAGDGGEPALPLGTSAWQRVLDLRPARPPTLDERVWRRILAVDDVEACRG